MVAQRPFYVRTSFFPLRGFRAARKADGRVRLELQLPEGIAKLLDKLARRWDVSRSVAVARLVEAEVRPLEGSATTKPRTIEGWEASREEPIRKRPLAEASLVEPLPTRVAELRRRIESVRRK